jgi:hypothetical protein
MTVGWIKRHQTVWLTRGGTLAAIVTDRSASN